MKTRTLKDNETVFIGKTLYFKCCDCGLRHKFTFTLDSLKFKVKRLNHFKGLKKYDTKRTKKLRKIN